MFNYLVADWMSTPPLQIAPTTSIASAKRIMEEHQVRRLPVVSQGRLVGIVTSGDLRAAQPSAATTLSVFEWNTLLNRVTVAEIMTRDPVTVSCDNSILEAAQLMHTSKIGGLPVMDGNTLVGVITESDLFRLLVTLITNPSNVPTNIETSHMREHGAVLS